MSFDRFRSQPEKGPSEEPRLEGVIEPLENLRPSTLEEYLVRDNFFPSTATETRQLLRQSETPILNAILDDPNHEVLTPDRFPQPPGSSYQKVFPLDTSDATVLVSEAQGPNRDIVLAIRTDGTSIEYNVARINLLTGGGLHVAFHGEDIKRDSVLRTAGGIRLSYVNQMSVSIHHYMTNFNRRDARTIYHLLPCPDADYRNPTEEALAQQSFAHNLYDILADYSRLRS